MFGVPLKLLMLFPYIGMISGQQMRGFVAMALRIQSDQVVAQP
jgi:hypothetical protein